MDDRFQPGDHLGPVAHQDGRFGKWLDGARDWNLSRNRFWGTAIPVWKAEDGGMVCVGSIEELARLSGRDPATITDLHTHFIDAIEINTNDGKTYDPPGKVYRRTSEVLDCWFESGSMPYAQLHYPFENSEGFDRLFPADFIAEGLDQTRGWFYPHGAGCGPVPEARLQERDRQRDPAGRRWSEMSKSLRNYPDPGLILEQIGADALRCT
ncbi:MAG: class I tRNA ligase family protein [Fibrobacteres bacterium]|nr:class I tRNA ligase family protein [Fibrobacterota bacterium]